MEDLQNTFSTNPTDNRLRRINEALDYHDPVNEKIRAYNDAYYKKQQEAQVPDALKVPTEKIDDGEKVYDVLKKDDGYYISGVKDVGVNEARVFDEPIYYGTGIPTTANDKSIFDSMKQGVGNFAEGVARGTAQGLTDLTTNALSAVIDNPLGRQYVDENDIQAFNTFRDWIQQEVRSKNDKALEDTTAGKVGAFGAEIGVQFVAPAMKGYNMLRGIGASPLVASAISDVVTSIIGVNPNDPNMSSMIPADSPYLAPIREVLATNPNDGEWENRAKNAAEALIGLGVGEVAARGLVSGVGQINKWAKDKNIPQHFMDKLDEYIQNESGSVNFGGKDMPEIPENTRILQKAVELVGSSRPAGLPVIGDDALNQMRKAAQTTGNALEGADFNFSHIENSDQLGELINKVSEIYADPIAKAKRTTQSFSETQAKADLARMTGFDMEAVLKRQTGEVWNAEKLKAARDIFVQQTDLTTKLAQAIKEPGGESPEALLAFRRQLAIVSALQMQIKGAQTETARALSQFRMTAKSPLESKVMVNDMIIQAGGKDMNAGIVDAYLNVVQNGSPDAAARFARNVGDITIPDMLYEGWINSLLGSPVTHTTNITGNLLATAVGTVERFGAAAYGAGERTAMKMIGRNMGHGGIYTQEALAYSRGMAMSVWDALRAGFNALKTGEGSDIFSKLDYAPKITSQNINQLPIAKSIAGRIGKDELLTTNSPMALFVDNYAEYYMRLPGRFLMAEDDFFKTWLYRSELHAQSAREAMTLNLDDAQASARRARILDDPQMEAPDIHINSMEHAREFTFTESPGEIGQKFSQSLSAMKLGDVPVGRVVVPFFNVINNIMKFAAARTPGLALLNPRSRTYKDLFSGDAARRQMVMGKWATGGAVAGWAAWLNQNGVCTGRMTDNPQLLKQMKAQGKMPYSCQVQMPDGSFKMAQYNRLDPVGMIMGIASTTSEILNHVGNDQEDVKQNLVVAATSAILPYLEDKSFFKGMADFANALWPQYADDQARVKALGNYFIDLASTAPGAVLGPASPGTPLSRWARRELAGDTNLRETNPDPYRVGKDMFGDDVLVPNDEFEYRAWEGIVKNIMDTTSGLSSKLPPKTNLWGEPIHFENGVYSDSLFSPIVSTKMTYNPDALKKLNLPDQMKNGYFNGIQVGRDISVDQYMKWVNIVGIDGELERLGAPITMPKRELSAKEGARSIGLPVKLNDEQYHQFVQIMNKISVPNDADPDRKSMNMKQMLDWVVRQDSYARLPDDKDATGAKSDILREVVNKYRDAAANIFFEDPENKLLRKHSILLKSKAQNTGVR